MMDFFSKLSKKEKTGIVVAGIIVLLAFSDGLIIRPIRERVTGLNDQIKMRREELKRNLQNLSQKETVSREYEKYARYVTKAGSDEEAVAQILAEVEELARESRVYLVDTKPQPPVEAGFYKEYKAEIEIEGRVDAIVDFLYQLNNSTQLLRAEKLRIASKSKVSTTAKAFILITKVLIL